MSLRGLRYRGMTLDVRLSGGGSRVESCTVDGLAGDPVVAAEGQGHHTVEVALTD